MSSIISIFKGFSDSINGFFSMLIPSTSPVWLGLLLTVVFYILAKLCPGYRFWLILKVVFYVIMFSSIIGLIYPILAFFGL